MRRRTSIRRGKRGGGKKARSTATAFNTLLLARFHSPYNHYVHNQHGYHRGYDNMRGGGGGGGFSHKREKGGAHFNTASAEACNDVVPCEFFCFHLI